MNYLIFPTQLYYNLDIKHDYHIYLIEEPFYFTHHKYHKLKLAYHRATMRKYYDYLHDKKYNIKYIEFNQVTNSFYKKLKESTFISPSDITLLNKLKKLMKTNILNNIQFLLSVEEINEMKDKFYSNKKYHNDSFYKLMRIKYNILMHNNKPIGNVWSYDKENRINLPKDIHIPNLPKIHKNNYIEEAINYVNKHFKNNYGSLDNFIYPIDYKSSIEWLNDFLKTKLKLFGKYEDAVSTKSDFVFHSILTPMMNIGLLLDKEVLEISNNYYLKHKESIPISSYEGFIRQVIGWRQYVYSIYILDGNTLRKSNLLKHKNKLNDNWWNDVKITPINHLIDKIKKYAYVHHIERLMFLSNWLLLNQIHPNEVFRIFMEWTIDAYEWVMIPNVYGMGQYASNMMMTRIYFSSSNYILKMSNFKNDNTNWAPIWDALYYNFVNKHKKILAANYATAVQVKNYNKKTKEEKLQITKISKDYMKSIK